MNPPVFALLSASPAVTAIVGTAPVRAYGFAYAPQDAPLPHVTWQVVSGVPEQVLDRPGIDNARVQVDCWAADATGCRQLADAVREALEDDGRNVMISDNGDTYDDDAKQYRRSFDFSFWIPR